VWYKEQIGCTWVRKRERDEEVLVAYKIMGARGERLEVKSRNEVNSDLRIMLSYIMRSCLYRQDLNSIS
jgi:hypothetical protein